MYNVLIIVNNLKINKMAKSKMTIGQYAMGLVSVGILFFVIGYSLERGKEQGA